MRSTFLAAFALLICGCGSKTELMPMELGRTWTYTVFTGFETFVEPVKVVRRIAVGGVEGFELQGPMGTCRIAWTGIKLIGDQMGSVRFDPPVPLLVPGAKAPTPWRGRLERLTGPVDAEAILQQADESVNVGSQSYKTTKATLTVSAKGQRIELVTWFSPAYGIVRQEQHTDGRLNLSLELLSGPS